MTYIRDHMHNWIRIHSGLIQWPGFQTSFSSLIYWSTHQHLIFYFFKTLYYNKLYHQIFKGKKGEKKNLSFNSQSLYSSVHSSKSSTSSIKTLIQTKFPQKTPKVRIRNRKIAPVLIRLTGFLILKWKIIISPLRFWIL